MKRLLELACFNYESALLAAKAGVHRIELCSNYCVGGLTPAITEILRVREHLDIPVHVIIRPREGNFVYKAEEIDRMKAVIAFCRNNGIDGVVFGVLDNTNRIDLQTNRELLALCGTMNKTFHRAVDACDDYEDAIGQIVTLGFTHVLTSGGKTTVAEGVDEIQSVQKKYGSRITIMPGGGIRSSNLERIIATSACSQFHSAAIKAGSDLPSESEIKKLLEIIYETP